MNVKELLSNNFKEITDEAVKIIKNGGIIIAPFDTVYGLICDPKNDVALERIFRLKQRGMSQTIGLAVDSAKTLHLIISPDHPKLPDNPEFFTNTLIFIAKTNNLSKYCLKNGTVAIRIPNSELIKSIAKANRRVIAQTSANISGKPPCNSIVEIKHQFSSEELEKIDLIIDGGSIENSVPSRIFDLTGEKSVEIAR